MHGRKKNIQEAARAAANRGDDLEPDALSILAGGGGGPTPRSVQAALLACGLHVHADVRVAADLVGLGSMGDEELTELAELARRDWEPLVKGSTLPLLALLDAQLKVQALHAVLDARTVSSSNRAASLAKIAGSLKELHAHSAAAYSDNVVVEWVEGDA